MKNLYSLIIVAIVAMSMFSCGQKNNFEARIDGWGDDTIQMMGFNGVEAMDTVLVAKDGFLSYNLTVDDTLEVMFFNNNKLNEAYTITTTIYSGSRESIRGVAYKDRLEYSSKGDKIFRERSELRQQKLPYMIAVDSLSQLIDSLYRMSSEDENISQLLDQINEVNKDVADIDKAFVRQNPDNELSAQYLFTSMISRDSIPVYFEILTPRVKNGLYKKLLFGIERDVLAQEAKKNIGEGKPAPQFTLMDLDGKQVSLSDFKGRWVVLDLWGSWCGWCIRGFPALKTSYEKHKDKVTFIGIACREVNEEDWRKSVADNKLPWLQLISSNDLNSDVSIKYAVEGFPTKIIITPEQTIAKIVVGEKPEFYTALDELLK